MDASLLAALVVATAALVVRRHWWLTRVRSWSMYPTLRPPTLVPTRRIGGGRRIGRGDIVVIDSAELGFRVIKRVIGLPGDDVRIHPDQVAINGHRLEEPYLNTRGGPSGHFRVPPNAYLVLGDNRTRSSDSRSWASPYVPAAAIRGRLAVRSPATAPTGSAPGRLTGPWARGWPAWAVRCSRT